MEGRGRQPVGAVQLRADGVHHADLVLDQADSTNGTDPVAGGDSGGPVIAYDAAGLKVVGSIIGGNDVTVYFHSYHHVVPSGWTVDTM